jgi:NAD(P)-dependent dehydrogenase (short-subunit alcohol dehydrogenase family)
MRAVVTGATSGIGEAIARRLAGEGLTVTMVGRSDERLKDAAARIEAAAPGADLVLERADLAELAQVRDLAARLLDQPRPDAVISNAALVTPLERTTTDGLPRVLAVNHLAPYLLLRMLAPELGKARLVVVGADPVSLVHAPVDLDDLQFAHLDRLGAPAELLPFIAYGFTKNMNAMFVYALARRLSPGVTVNGAHPGVILGTGLGKETPGIGEAIGNAVRSGILPVPGPQPTGHGAATSAEGPGPDVGADTPAWLATSPEVEGVTGRFYVDRAIVETAPHTTDTQRCDRLWHESARLVGLPA